MYKIIVLLIYCSCVVGSHAKIISCCCPPVALQVACCPAVNELHTAAEQHGSIGVQDTGLFLYRDQFSSLWYDVHLTEHCIYLS
jgi:hypothetical protein